jgi:hypothetical protein
LTIAAVVVVIDMASWVITIFTLAGPMMVGGIHDAMLDWAVLKHLHDQLTTEELGTDGTRLSPKQKIEILIALLVGILNNEVGNPRAAL